MQTGTFPTAAHWGVEASSLQADLGESPSRLQLLHALLQSDAAQPGAHPEDEKQENSDTVWRGLTSARQCKMLVRLSTVDRNNAGGCILIVHFVTCLTNAQK